MLPALVLAASLAAAPPPDAVIRVSLAGYLPGTPASAVILSKRSLDGVTYRIVESTTGKTVRKGAVSNVRGGLVDGPVKAAIFGSLKGVTLTREDAFAAFQSEGAVWHDDVMDYATNEPTMDGTAEAILMFALLGRPGISSNE